jgi:DeoR/GlpR family transcriptional regulator of sugar metabolism
MQEHAADDLDVEKRRQQILEILGRDAKAKVNDLSKRFGISEVTIRSDLGALEDLGLLERVHGGAVSTHKAYYNMSFHERLHTHEPEKIEIARAVASMISEGDSLMMDSGTTTLLIARELKKIKNLTIVTNSLTVASEIGDRENVHLILLGGYLDQRYQFTYGDDTLGQLKKYKADLMILSADGISVDDGITTHHHQEAEVSRQMMARADKTVAAADFSKIGRSSFAFINSVESIDILVTNKNANPEELAQLAEKGIQIKVV